MKAIMLAAGVSTRLGNDAANHLPKILLRFGGKSLLQYHIEILKRHGISEMVLGVGYQSQKIEQEIATLGVQGFVKTVLNKDYQEGSVVTLSVLSDEMRCGSPILLMDADVLYSEDLIGCLINSRHDNSLLLDRNIEPGDEPVKICIRDNEIVEFRKLLNTDFDYCGESVGFFKLSTEIAEKIALQAKLYLNSDRGCEPYEEVIRDIILSSPQGTFRFEDITGKPWIEIDFITDIERANTEILPRILTAARI